MRRPACLIFLCFLYLAGCTQMEGRIKITSIIPGENTGQDYSSWLSDDLNNLIPNCWNPSNFKYIDITLKLKSTSKISKLSLYDYEGVFTDNPAYIYALHNSKKTLIGTFTGEHYKVFEDLIPDTSLIADALVIHKYANNIPQKIEVFGSVYNEGNPPADSLPRSVITFNELPNKTEGDAAFKVTAQSNNTETPVKFVSSDSSVVSLSYSENVWMAYIKAAGTATITASQAANSHFQAAANVDRNIIIRAAGSITITNGEIPIDAKRWFQLTNASNGLDGLFDGKTDANVQTGYGKIVNNYDSYYPVTDGEQIDLSGVKMYDGQGSSTTEPMKLSVITGEGQKITVATFTGTQYNTWVGPDPDNPSKFNLQTTFHNIKYLVINSWNFFPTEIQFYGNYTAGKSITPATIKSFPLKQMFGINGFEWNFEDPNNPLHIDNQRFKAAKTFTGLRHYMDWEKLESSPGSYTFNPTNSGGWNYDVLYDSCKRAGIEVLACLKTLPGWMQQTYPADQRDAENVPVKYGRDFTNPMSYIEQSKAAFQYAARYGSNKNVNRSLLHVNNNPRWSGDSINTIKVGLGTVRYIECDNERDKWWKGRKAYQTAFEYAANLSAFYDGNKNTMGAGVGVKNADPNMKVVMAGTALAVTDYLKGMVDWCRRNRGYKTDGTVNLCWDVINYHLYSADSKTSQSGNAARGAAPELSGAAEVAADFIQAAHQYANDMPVWVTELGYDVNQGSPYKAIPIGNKTALQTQADWILRSSLLYARCGIERIFFYEMYDDNPSSSIQFGSCGLINTDKTRKPAADYIYQANNLFGNYTYQKTINKDPFVDCYKSNTSTMYVIAVPDEKGRTTQYTLDLDSASYAKIYTPKTGSDTMSMRIAATVSGKLKITATETPVFVIAYGNSILTGQNNSLENIINVYPNPSSGLINIALSSKAAGNVQIKICEAGSGKIYKNIQFSKGSGYISRSVNTHSWPSGYYIVAVKQGDDTIVKKILKTF